MGLNAIEAPALFSLLLFLGVNYVCGYQFGHMLTGSVVFGVVLAMAMPLITLVAMALLRVRATDTTPHPDPSWPAPKA